MVRLSTDSKMYWFDYYKEEAVGWAGPFGKKELRDLRKHAEALDRSQKDGKFRLEHGVEMTDHEEAEKT